MIMLPSPSIRQSRPRIPNAGFILTSTFQTNPGSLTVKTCEDSNSSQFSPSAILIRPDCLNLATSIGLFPMTFETLSHFLTTSGNSSRSSSVIKSASFSRTPPKSLSTSRLFFILNANPAILTTIIIQAITINIIIIPRFIHTPLNLLYTVQLNSIHCSSYCQ